MAEIPVERKSSKLPWLLLALGIFIAILIWLFASANDENIRVASGDVAATDVVEQIDPIGENALTEGELPVAVTPSAQYSLADVLGDPIAYVGRDDFDDEVETPSVPTDRGFWVENDGARLFAILIDGPREAPIDINPGQDLRISKGMLRDADFVGDIPGKPLDADTRAILAEQDVFLLVHEDNIEILN